MNASHDIEISQQVLDAYRGGQVVMTSYETGYIKRGDIKEIKFHTDSNEVAIDFLWLAKNTGSPRNPSREWTKIDDQDTLVFGLDSCRIYDEGRDRIRIWEPVIDLTILLLLPGDPFAINRVHVKTKYSYSILRVRENGRERLICCLNSEELPPLDPSRVILAVSDRVSFLELPKLKDKLWQLAQDQEIESVTNLQPSFLAKGV